jgi:hypothetical protein
MTSNKKGLLKVAVVGASAALTAATAGGAALVVILSGVVAALGAAVTLQSEPMTRPKRNPNGSIVDTEEPK